MRLPQASAASLRDGLSGPLRELVDRFDETREPTAAGQASPPLIEEAFNRLFEAMEQTEAAPGAGTGNLPAGDDVTQLGEYSLELFDHAMQWANRLELADVFEELQTHAVAMARWIAAREGRMTNLEPVVDALARCANQTRDPGELVALYEAMSETLDATAEVIRRDPEKSNPARPWRILHLNRAIVATRTHRTDLMEQAFDSLVEQLPEDAPGFFAQGMEQMDLLNYPSHVRDVMSRYYRNWSVNRSLH